MNNAARREQAVTLDSLQLALHYLSRPVAAHHASESASVMTIVAKHMRRAGKAVRS